MRSTILVSTSPRFGDLGFIISDGQGFWVEVKRIADYDIRFLAPGVPAFEIIHKHERYRFRLRISPDPRREVLAVEFHLDANPGLCAYVLLAPHLGATGHGNRAAVRNMPAGLRWLPRKVRSPSPSWSLTDSSVTA